MERVLTITIERNVNHMIAGMKEGEQARADLDLEQVASKSGQRHNLGRGLRCGCEGVQVLGYEGGVQLHRCKRWVTCQALQEGDIRRQPAHLSS